MVAKFNCRHTELSLVVCYAPTNSETHADDLANKDAFYNHLDNVASSIPKHDIWIIIGDMNAQLENDTNTWKSALGNYAEGTLNMPNDNDIRLLFFCQTHNVIVGSSLFPHKKIHKLSCNSTDRKTVS